MTLNTVKVELSKETYKLLEAIAKDMNLTLQETLIRIVQENLDRLEH